MLMESLPWIKSFNKILSRILAMIDKGERGREEDPFDPSWNKYIYIGIEKVV